MTLPRTMLPLPSIITPNSEFPPMMLRSAATSPPIVVPVALLPIEMPCAFGVAVCPVRFVPMKLPRIELPDEMTVIPGPANPLMTSPRTVLPSPAIVRPLTPRPASAPFSSIIGAPGAEPGCVNPSIITLLVIIGSGDAGEIVNGGDPPPTSKMIASSPAPFAFAFRIA
jgi:hypothetical protein